MKNITWKDKIETFEVMDVRGQSVEVLFGIEAKSCRKEKRRGLARRSDLRSRAAQIKSSPGL